MQGFFLLKYELYLLIFFRVQATHFLFVTLHFRFKALEFVLALPQSLAHPGGRDLRMHQYGAQQEDGEDRENAVNTAFELLVSLVVVHGGDCGVEGGNRGKKGGAGFRVLSRPRGR